MKTDKKTIRKVFESNTEKNEVFITSDGHKFFESAHAKNHSKTLADTSITTVTREEAMTDESDEDRLETIDNRLSQIKQIVDEYKPEWEALVEEKEEIESRLQATAGTDESAAEAIRKSQEAADKASQEAAEQQKQEEAEKAAKAEAERKAQEEADAAAAEAKKKEEEEAAAAAAKTSKNNKK